MEQNKKREQLEELILASYGAMYRLAYSYVGNEHDAMDIVQESILKAYKGIGNLKEERFMKTWLWRIVIRTSVDVEKERRRNAPLPDEDLTGREDRYRDFDTVEALRVLGGTERAVIVLRYFEDRKLSEVAQILEMNLNTVKTVVGRSLKKLRVELMEGELADEG